MSETEASLPDDNFPKLDPETVLETIKEGLEHSRIIWTPTILLHWLGVKGLDYPTLLRRRAKRILEQLYEEGHLIRRPEAHSGSIRSGGREVAYMLPKGRPAAALLPKELVYDPHTGGSLLSGKRADRTQVMDDVSWGLMALGRSGSWQIDLDETTSGPDEWCLTVDGPSIYLTIEIASPLVAEALLQFFARTEGRLEHSEFIVGICLAVQVVVIKDLEFADRYFVRLAGTKTICLFTLVGTHLIELQDALRQVVADLAG